MSKFESIVQSAAEQLLEDGGLRSNLTDDEANSVIEWAIEWLTGQVNQAHDEASARQVAKAEIKRLRPALQGINRQLAPGQAKLSGLSAIRQALPGAPPDRQKLIRSLIAQQVEAWSKK